MTQRPSREKAPLVSCMGGVWRMSERNLQRVLKLIKLDREFDLDVFGTYLGRCDVNVTDMDSEEASCELESRRQIAKGRRRADR